MFYWQSDRPYSQEEINKIFLQRKKTFNRDEVISAAAHAMGEQVITLEEPINQGSVNLVCPFKTISGLEGVIRVHPPQAKNGYFFAETAAMRAAAKIDVPVPEVILVDDSRQYAPFDYMVMTRVPGEVMRPAVERDPSLHPSYLRQIGRYLGMLHTIKTDNFGFFDNDQAKSGKLIGIDKTNQAHYLAALDKDKKFHTENPGTFDAKTLARAFKVLEDNISMAECKHPTLVHNDIADWNTVVEGKKVTGILDWDECFSGDPVFEFATLSLFYPDEKLGYIKSGYQEISSLPSDYEDKFDLYVLRYIINKSKIAITKIKYAEKTSMKEWLENANAKLANSSAKLVKILANYS